MSAVHLLPLMLGIAVLGAGCVDSLTMPTVVGPSQRVAVLVGAGDIAECTQGGPVVTAAILDSVLGTVFTAGDNAYPVGSLADYRRCYEPNWGRHRARTKPAPGNHEYETAGAAGYFDYFGEAAGPRGLGYYSFTEGQWFVVSLNSNIDADVDSAQFRWLRTALAESTAKCTLAIWHHPIISSGPNGGSPAMLEVWRLLSEAGADVVVNSHEHLYERYGFLDARGQPAPTGLRMFVVGTGGAPLSRVVRVRPGSLVQISAWGVLKLTLRADSYDWNFLTAPEGTASEDEGHGVCR